MNTHIGKRLKRIMAERELSAAQLAKIADVKPSFIYDILHGKSTNPSIVKLLQIAQALDLGIEMLVMESPPLPQSHAHTSAHEEETDYVAISSVLVEATMGVGGVEAAEMQGKPYYFRKEWIRDRLGVNAQDLRMIYVRGDSMEPTLCAGDIVLVDISKTSPTPPGIFILHDGLGLVAKRLEYIAHTQPPTVRIISDNAQYGAYERTVDELHIIGRVVWFAREV